MSEIKKGDMVKHVFKKFKYKVLEVKKEKDYFDDVKDMLGKRFRNVKCLCENGDEGWLSSEELIKIK